MTPVRVLAAKGPTAAAATLAPGAMVAAAVGFLGWAIGRVNLMLLGVVLVAVVGDVIAGSLRAFISPAERLNRDRMLVGIAKKMLAACLIIVGLVLDWSLRVGVPGAEEFFRAHMPWTRFALFSLIALEGSSLLRNVKTVIRVSKAFQQAFDTLARGGEMEAVKALDAAIAPDDFGRRRTDRELSAEERDAA